MKIAAWNINGLRSGFGKFWEFVGVEKPDIICLQEIKLDPAVLPAEIKSPPGYYCYFSFAQRPGYSGVAIYSREKPRGVVSGIGVEEIDREGRVIGARIGSLNIYNFYFPHSGRKLERLDFKIKFSEIFVKFAAGLLRKNRDIVLCGDFNVAHKEIDIARPRDNRKNAGFTDIERKWMDKILKIGFDDAYRKLNPSKQEFTWWSNRAGVRERNIGWRIDYFLTNQKIAGKIKECRILTGIFGSDHCPLVLEIH